MSYSYNLCYCRECLKMDLTDRYKYDENYAYCTAYNKYYPINDKACSRYFEYDYSKNTNSSSCYLTTIVCDILKYSDDCIYLTVLREFRENYMRKDKNLVPLLIEYDVVGPVISEFIKNSKEKENISKYLFINYIKLVSDFILNKEYTKAIIKYTEMVNLLKNIYNLNINYNMDNLNYDEEKIGKGYQILIR